MNFVWALFFIGAGDIEPIDTGYRFADASECFTERHNIGRRRSDIFLIHWDKDGKPTTEKESLAIEAQVTLEEQASDFALEYTCIVHK